MEYERDTLCKSGGFLPHSTYTPTKPYIYYMYENIFPCTQYLSSGRERDMPAVSVYKSRGLTLAEQAYKKKEHIVGLYMLEYLEISCPTKTYDTCVRHLF